MYISDLSLHGFKSFAKKERLRFGEGITAVVGPNGCGKTNIVDAIRWVLGEQKYSQLRSSRMEDIIFNGSDSRKPLNVCEVSLVVHNDKGKLPVDYTDVEITRRAFRNGESQYMINRSACRLKDILNLFIDTGMGADAYSVIELGMIEEILSENADDRRKMFEEAAGVNKYKRQRKSALRRLEATLADLDRVNDIIVEVEDKVHSLGLQLKRFDRHARLTDKLEKHELELAFLRKRKIQKALEPVKERISTIQRQQAMHADEERDRETVLAQVQKTYHQQQSALNELQKKLDKLAEQRQEENNRILVLSEQVRSAERTIERLELQREEGSKKVRSHRFSIEELEAELQALGPRIDEKLSAYNDGRAEFGHIEKGYRELEKRLEHLNSRYVEHLRKVNDARSLHERTEEFLSDKRRQLEHLESRSAELEKRQEESENIQQGLEKKRKGLQTKLSRERKRLAKLDSLIENLRSKKHNSSLQFHRIASQVEGLETQLQFYKEIIENREGYPSGVRHVLGRLEDYPGVLGTVADMIEVDGQYRSAIEAALGSFAHCLVCKTRDEALKIVGELAGEKVGGISIIPLDSVGTADRKKSPLPKRKGVVGVAVELVKTQKEVRPLVDSLLRDLVVVEDSRVAQYLWKSESFTGSIADLQGRYYGRGGVITSVKGGAEVSVLGRREKVAELDKAIDALVKKGNTIQQKLLEIDAGLEEREREHHALSTNLGEHIDTLAGLEREITQNEFAISQNMEQLRDVTHQIVSTRQDILNLEKSLDRLIPKLRALEEQQANYQEKIERAKDELEEIKKQRDMKSNAIQEIRLELINLENDRDNLNYRIQGMRESIGELEQRKTELTDEQQALQAQVRQMGDEIKKLRQSLEKVIAQYRKESSVRDLKEQAFADMYDHMEALQREIRNEQKDRQALAEELKRTELQVADYERQIDLLSNRVQEKYQQQIPSAMDVALSDDELSLEIDRIERSIERIGPINMAVKDEHDAEQSRLEFLKRQREDLLESEQSLMKTMHHIDARARKQFLETFESIRRNFQRTFRLFFEGGEADLDLRGDVDPLEADIAILARPPGKRTRNLRMLSAGEKALTAISLLFAIYQVKPSPFCILDEVDAPLDDNNIGKFAKALKRFSEETQFIIVTHNKLTMEAARYLYGVTMQESGISKIVSVEMN